MQLCLNKQLQPREIKSYKHKIKNQTSKNRKQCAIHKVHINIYTYSQSIIQSLTNKSIKSIGHM